MHEEEPAEPDFGEEYAGRMDAADRAVWAEHAARAPVRSAI
jgi:hypothetical protein